MKDKTKNPKLLQRLSSLQRQALNECLRANNDTLNTIGINDISDLYIKSIEGFDTNDNWDDIQWHAGYIQAMKEAMEVVTDKTL